MSQWIQHDAILLPLVAKYGTKWSVIMEHMPDNVSASAARNRWNRICKTNSKSRNKCKKCGQPKAGHNWVACKLNAQAQKPLELKQSDVDVQDEQPEEEQLSVSLKKEEQISTEDLYDIITDSLMSDTEYTNDMTYSMLFTDLDYVPVTPKLEWSHNFDFNCVSNPQVVQHDIRMIYHQEPRLQLPSHHTRTIRKLVMN
jgi:hypothetical protein